VNGKTFELKRKASSVVGGVAVDDDADFYEVVGEESSQRRGMNFINSLELGGCRWRVEGFDFY
jgi:hypothetical protein